MAVKIGHARGDEKGQAKGGQAGDQTGKEVCISNWYKQPAEKAWVILRAVNAEVAKLLVYAMQRACDNNRIGYDQGQRNTLYNLAKAVGFDLGKVDTACETDCSALVRVCLAYAGIMVGDFTTGNQVATIMKTGLFDKLTYKTYSERSDYLRAGDILVTSVRGHTAIVMTDGPSTYKMDRPYLHKGDGGPVVKTLQVLLVGAGHKLPKYGTDGDFGSETDEALRAYQTARRLEADGVAGPKTWEALLGAQAPAGATYRVIVTVLPQDKAVALTDDIRPMGYPVSIMQEV